MSTRIHKCIGWAARPSELLRVINRDAWPDTDISELLSDWAHHIDMTYNTQTQPLRAESQHEKRSVMPYILNAGKSISTLVHEAYSFSHGEEGEEGIAYVFFLPWMGNENWFRFDDPIDYEEAKFLDDPMVDTFIELEYNPYPWMNNLMHRDTLEPVAWPGPCALSNHPQYRPDVAEEIKFYTSLSDRPLFQPKGWSVLKPMYGTWWS